jgi:hypothetical protein
MKLQNFSATFYCLTTFLLGLKGEIRNNVLAAERLLATSTPVSQWMNHRGQVLSIGIEFNPPFLTV